MGARSRVPPFPQVLDSRTMSDIPIYSNKPSQKREHLISEKRKVTVKIFHPSNARLGNVLQRCYADFSTGKTPRIRVQQRGRNCAQTSSLNILISTAPPPLVTRFETVYELFSAETGKNLILFMIF